MVFGLALGSQVAHHPYSPGAKKKWDLSMLGFLLSIKTGSCNQILFKDEFGVLMTDTNLFVAF